MDILVHIRREKMVCYISSHVIINYGAIYNLDFNTNIGRALAKPRAGEENNMTLTNRICDRCKKRYMTTEDGMHIVSEVCNYHWGRKFNTMGKIFAPRTRTHIISR